MPEKSVAAENAVQNSAVTRGEVTKVDVSALTLRGNANTLLLANPNYFGTLTETQFKPVQQIAGNTTFEQLTCVGLNAAIDQLEAVVRINQTGGYNGPLCGGGSTEYVRFHVSYDNGTTWTDAGGDSFTIHDSAGTRPLDFAVNVPKPMSHRWCIFTNQPLVRAILSWNRPPTPGDENFAPIWGNVVEVTVAPSSTRFPPFLDLIEATKIELPDWLLKQVDLEAVVPLKPKPTLSTAELVETYAKTDVEPHRFLAPMITKALATQTFAHLAIEQTAMAHPTPKLLPPNLLTSIDLASITAAGIDFGAIIGKYLETDGDTSFEELGCIGYDPVEDALVGVLTVKKPNGYSGGPCTAGSTEYVAFWIDWGSGYEYAGTAVAQVHDQTVPAGGLRFAVYLPIASFTHRRNCTDGAVEPRVRAILSWEHAPPATNPDYVPAWGNREETTIQLAAGAVTALQPVVDAISGVPVCHIDQSDGRTIGADQPFGATLTVSGFIPGAPDINTPPMKYRVQVRDAGAGGSFNTVAQDFWTTVTEQIGATLPHQRDVLQHADGDGYFDYLGDMNISGNGWRVVVNNLLYPWATAAPMTGLWEIKVDAKDAWGNPFPAQVISCTDGTYRSNVTVHLDEVAPVPDLQILHVTSPGGTPQPTGPCKKFKIGDVLDGTYSVSDEHFGSLSFTVEPAASALGKVPTLSGPTAFPAAPTSGTSGTWTLDTKLMAACGYVMTMWTQDRTIVSGSASGWQAHDLFGFSLEA